MLSFTFDLPLFSRVLYVDEEEGFSERLSSVRFKAPRDSTMSLLVLDPINPSGRLADVSSKAADDREWGVQSSPSSLFSMSVLISKGNG